MTDQSQIVEFGYTSQRLKNAVFEVLAELPADDLDMIRRRKVMIRECDIDGGYSFGTCEPETDRWVNHKCVISLDVARMPLDDVLKGLIVHELAHARLNHHDRVRQWRENPIPKDRRARAMEMAEREALDQMRQWGFTRELEEWQKFANARYLLIAKRTI